MPTPRVPYIAPVPDYGHWVVTFKYTKSSPPGPAAGSAPDGPASAPGPAAPASTAPADNVSPTSIDTIKTGDLRGIVFSYADGTSKQYTCQGDWVLTSGANGPTLGIATRTQGAYLDYMVGFIFLNGVKIDPSTFKEAALRDGAPAFHYKSGDTEVWINPETMLPLAVKRPGVEADYQFLTPPPRPFPIPSDQAALLQKEQHAYETTREMR